FDCCKWDPQVEDVATLAPFPLMLRPQAWDELARLAEALAAETAAAEKELLQRPNLHRRLGLPRAVRRALAKATAAGPCRETARVMRFDFHWTPDGWRISEANTDVPGGFNEGSGFARLMASWYPDSEVAGDPAGALAEAVAATTRPGAAVALVHATAYTDDHQVMVFLARELAARERRAVLAAPDHLRWRDGRAMVESRWFSGDVETVIRFFPGEWLPNLPRACGWQHFFQAGRTPVSNPAAALLTQSKRFPLVWDRLDQPLPTWRRLLPATCEPADSGAATGDDWVLKPALGRVGDGIGLEGVTPRKELAEIRRSARWRGSWWAAQRRFHAAPLAVAGQEVYPCVGVFTVDGRAAGAYGRVAKVPLVNHLARDAAVLIARRQDDLEEHRHGTVGAV
ncbi:MAG TPA: glutathionylspermidine synthase family protein, partial [Thermoanaerobaculia bacterium]|nr:glutathionylspermidine synthase family protein [Thermoanaerobaculia bacterium]